MADHMLRTRRRGDWQTIARIKPKEASGIFEQCERFLANSSALKGSGFGGFLNEIEEAVLLLALQPDSWGERTKARLVSYIAGSFRKTPGQQETLTVEDLMRISNVLLPCLLLELGRRRQHLQVEFPVDPFHTSATIRISFGTSNPVHSLDHEQLQALVSKRGEELVGLCYFGDHASRARIEADLTPKTLPAA